MTQRLGPSAFTAVAWDSTPGRDLRPTKPCSRAQIDRQTDDRLEFLKTELTDTGNTLVDARVGGRGQGGKTFF